ncbi:MAG: hypothetical protein IJL77_01800 [Clostridia bacterium]|nr:hypothetical protein [Clostridia bacterium]
MTNKELVSEYKRVMNSFEIPSDVQARLISKSLGAFTGSDNDNKYFNAVIAVSGIAAVAAGIGAVKLFNRIFGD